MKAHQMTQEQYIIKHEFNGEHPTCLCGCGERVAFHKNGFRKFVHSHAARHAETRQLMIDGGRAAAADPAKRKKNSDAVKEKWKDPVYVANVMTREEKRIASLRDVWNSSEFSQTCSDARKKLWQDEEWSEKQREMMKGEEFRAATSAGTKIGLDDVNIRRRLSEHAAEMIANGTTGPQRSKREWVMNPFTGNNELMHSTWERAFLQRCIEIGFPVTKKHEIRIKYTAEDGRERTYVPDFVSLDGKHVIEIKGYMNECDVLKNTTAKKLFGDSFIVISTLESIVSFNEMQLAIHNEKEIT